MKMKNLIYEKEKTEESLYKKINKGNKFRKLYKKKMIEKMKEIKRAEEAMDLQSENLVEAYLGTLPENCNRNNQFERPKKNY